MTWISRTTTAFGIVLLAHACYSAQEHSALKSSRSIPSPASAPPSSSLPVDIAVETVVATVVICLGLVLGAPALRPIRWRSWAGAIERKGPRAFATASEADDALSPVAGNPFRILESRPGFVDIRRQRKEFAQWVKGGALGGKQQGSA